MTAPASPCIGLCTLDDASRCTGCQRTRDEIAAWRDMGDAEKRRVLERLRGRAETAPDAAADAFGRLRDAVRRAAPAVIAAHQACERRIAEALVEHLRRPDMRRALRDFAEALDRARIAAAPSVRRGTRP